MDIEADWVLDLIYEIYANAPEETRKELYIDDYSNAISDQRLVLANKLIFPWLRKSIDQDLEKQNRILDQFKSIGTEVVITNPIQSFKDKLLPFSGRNHLKAVRAFRAGRKVLYFDGFNHEASEVDEAELMGKFIGETAVNISEELDAVLANERTTDFKKEVGDGIWLIYDTGTPGQSKILEEDLQIAKSSSRLRGLSYFYPEGDYLQVLNELHKEGKDVEILTHNPRLRSPYPLTTNLPIWLMNKKTALVDMLIKGKRIPLLDYPQGVHGKLLLSSQPDGSEVALWGTHNLNSEGVKKGTQEWQLLITNPELVNNLDTKYQFFANRAKNPALVS